MSREQNLQIVQRGYEAFGRGDIAGLLAILADDVQWTTPGPPELPVAGDRHGVAQVAQFFATLNEVFQFEGFDPQTFMADGDRVAVFGTSTVRLRLNGKLMPALPWVHSFQLANGRVTRFQEYFDASAIAAELQAAHQQA